MDHIVYLDYKSKELELIVSWNKTMLIRWAMWRKLPYWRVSVWDKLFFINNNWEWLIKWEAIVSSVFNSEKLTKEESFVLVKNNQSKLNLTDIQFNKWSSKRYIILIEFSNFALIPSFEIDKTNYSNMDDWLLIEDIDKVKVN